MSGAIPPLPTRLNSFNRRRIYRAVCNEVTKNVMMDDAACMGDVEIEYVELHNTDQWQAFATMIIILYIRNMHAIVSLVISFNLS